MLPLWTLCIAVPMIMVALGLGIVVGYHRVLTHRATTLHPLVEKALVLTALGAGTPIQWIGNHRFHHAHVDTPRDPHSPAHRGFWVAHCGWYLGTSSTALSLAYAVAGPLRTIFDAFWRPRTGNDHIGLAGDVAADPFYAWISRPGPYAFVLLAQVAVLWTAFMLLWGPLPGAAAMTFLHLAAYTLGDAVNSLGHVGGKANNSLALAVITFGDGWHGAHHEHPRRIRAGPFDPAYVFIRVLQRLGLASTSKSP